MKIHETVLSADVLSRYRIKKRHIAASLLVLIVFLLNNKYFMFGFISILSGVFSFYHDKHNHSPIDFKLALFMGILVTKYFGLTFTILFFIFSDLIPSILGGGSIEGADLLFIGWYFIVNSVVLLFPGADIVVLGIFLVLLETIGSTMIKSFTGFPGMVAFLSSLMSVLVRIVYFLTLGGFFVRILEGVLYV